MNVAVVLGALLGLWPFGIDHDHYQHEARGDVTVRASFGGWLRVEVFYGLDWWGRPDAKIPSSFLNLEANRALCRRYGAEARVGRVGGFGLNVARRGCEEFDGPRRWGDKIADSTHQWTIGYHDGLRPVLFWRTVTLVGPYLAQWNGGTLPWHAWRLTAAYDVFDVDVRVGGPRAGFVLDMGAVWPVTADLALGVRLGTVALPGWGRDAFRVAATLVVGAPRR